MQTFDTYFASLKGKKIAVLGLGVSNRPLVRLLLRYGCMVTGCDRTERSQLDDEVLELERSGCRLQLGEHYLADLQADVVFRTPGMHPDIPALAKLREQGAMITSEMEVFVEVCPCRILAVTGSDGKTTTTTLISEMLKAEGKTVWLGGNIGTPLLCMTPKMKETDFAVVELSSFQLIDMRRSPEIAVITNVAPNHLDVHKDMDEYVEAKKNIFKFQAQGNRLVLNADNEITKGFAGEAKAVVRCFSRRQPIAQGVYYTDGKIKCGETAVINIDEIKIPGMHNVENYMAAYCAVSHLVSDDTFRQVAREFSGVQHRLELIRSHKGVKYINDSIASSPTRAVAGLRSFKQGDSIILIAGGHDKHVPFDEMAEEVCKRCKALFLCGESAQAIAAAVRAADAYYDAFPMFIHEDWCENVLKAAAYAEEGDTILLSPACSSFDFFKNFAERGNLFRKIIMELE